MTIKMSKSKARPEKLDLYKFHKTEYAAARKPVLINTTPAVYLTISGRGAPGGDAFQACIGALYSMAFTIKMSRKFAGKGDYAVCKLEGQYWCDVMGTDFSSVPMENWQWTLMIRTPDFITIKDLETAVAALDKRGKVGLSGQVKLATIAEGACVQMLHVGPYEREKETVDKMVAFATTAGFVPHSRHHEIYLSDPRRVPPDRLKTILRLPVRLSLAGSIARPD
jgi:hypothetical protein